MNRGSLTPRHHCDTCDFGSDSERIFNEHYMSQYHLDAVFERNSRR